MLLVTLLLPDFVEAAQLRALFALQFLDLVKMKLLQLKELTYGFVELWSVSAFEQSDALQDLSQEDLTGDVDLVSELLYSSLTDLYWV